LITGNRWKYIRAKHQNKLYISIQTLLKDGCPNHNAKDKVNAHFKLVFTEENLSVMPKMDTTTDIPNILDISISQ